jgi:hypothetical protein
MEWTPEIAVELARYGCRDCRGTGRAGSIEPKALCSCVCRAVFRACHRRFQYCGEMRAAVRHVTFERIPGAVDRSLTWVRSAEDYRADFHACGLRRLPKHLYQFFSFYYLHGAKHDLVCRRLGISSRLGYDWMAEVETIVGREIAHLQPYSLFPPQGYTIPVGRARHVDLGRNPGSVTPKTGLISH